VERAKNERWINYALYHAVKELNAEGKQKTQVLTDSQQRLIDMYLLEARLNGINLTGGDKKEFIQHLGKLVEAKNHFRTRVTLSHNLFSHTITEMDIIKELPASLLNQLAVDKLNPSRGPWRVSLNQNIYDLFMQYCSHRVTRWNLWQVPYDSYLQYYIILYACIIFNNVKYLMLRHQKFCQYFSRKFCFFK